MSQQNDCKESLLLLFGTFPFCPNVPLKTCPLTPYRSKRSDRACNARMNRTVIHIANIYLVFPFSRSEQNSFLSNNFL